MKTGCKCGGSRKYLCNEKNSHGDVVNVFRCDRCGAETRRAVRRSRLYYMIQPSPELLAALVAPVRPTRR